MLCLIHKIPRLASTTIPLSRKNHGNRYRAVEDIQCSRRFGVDFSFRPCLSSRLITPKDTTLPLVLTPLPLPKNGNNNTTFPIPTIQLRCFGAAVLHEAAPVTFISLMHGITKEEGLDYHALSDRLALPIYAHAAQVLSSGRVIGSSGRMYII